MRYYQHGFIGVLALETVDSLVNPSKEVIQRFTIFDLDIFVKIK